MRRSPILNQLSPPAQTSLCHRFARTAAVYKVKNQPMVLSFIDEQAPVLKVLVSDSSVQVDAASAPIDSIGQFVIKKKTHKLVFKQQKLPSLPVRLVTKPILRPGFDTLCTSAQTDAQDKRYSFFRRTYSKSTTLRSQLLPEFSPGVISMADLDRTKDLTIDFRVTQASERSRREFEDEIKQQLLHSKHPSLIVDHQPQRCLSPFQMPLNSIFQFEQSPDDDDDEENEVEQNAYDQIENVNIDDRSQILENPNLVQFDESIESVIFERDIHSAIRQQEIRSSSVQRLKIDPDVEICE